MIGSLGNLPPYVLNRKRIKRTSDGKYKYRYPHDKGAVTVEMSEDLYLVMAEFDREEYNGDRKEFRHRGEPPVYHDDYEYEETDPLSNLPDESTYGMQDEICERLDREAVLAKLSTFDRKIYHLCGELDYTQTKAAEILKINQSTIARRLETICDLIETERLNDGSRTTDEIEFEKIWLELLRTGKTKYYDDIVIEYILSAFYINDLLFFMHWFYSFKELIRFILKCLALRGDYAQDDVNNFLKRASKKDKKHFAKHYWEEPLVFKSVFANMVIEVWHRMKFTNSMPKSSSYDILEAKKDKIVKRLKITDDEFYNERFFPMLTAKRQARHKEFLKKHEEFVKKYAK